MVQKNNINNKIIAIVGPTASGKTALSVELAKRLNGEIISADSMNVYSGLNVGTAKPTSVEMQNIKHYLIDVVSPEKQFSVGDYKELAEPIIKDILSSGKTPIICGGTGFYVNSLLYDFSYGNHGADLEVREKYMELAKSQGVNAVFDILIAKDPETALKLHPNDLKRVIRALEICENGIKKSELNDTLTPKYDFIAFSVDFERERLYSRINERVDLMIENGLVDEVKGLIDNGITIKNQCMQGIGYKEIYDYLMGNISLEQAIEQIKQNTRRYAKRQITFFKKMQNHYLIKPDTIENMANRIIEKL